MEVINFNQYWLTNGNDERLTISTSRKNYVKIAKM